MTTYAALARPVHKTWQALVRDHAPGELFTPALVASLPEAAQRRVLHAVEPGVPLWRSVELEMRGEIKIGMGRGPTSPAAHGASTATKTPSSCASPRTAGCRRW